MKTLKAVAARYNATSLILRIVIGLAVGAVLALAVRMSTYLPCW